MALKLTEVAAVLAPLLTAWADAMNMDDQPESVVVRMAGTGYKGGDAGHGGNLCLRISKGESYSNEIINEDEAATVIAYGDWEQAGLMCGLARALAQMLPLYTWASPFEVTISVGIPAQSELAELGKSLNEDECPF